MNDNNYNKLLDKLQLLYTNENSEKLFNTLTIIAALMNEIDGNLKGAKYLQQFQHDRLRITVSFGDYF